VRQKATGFSPAPGAQRGTPCRPQQAIPQRSRAQSPDKGIFAAIDKNKRSGKKIGLIETFSRVYPKKG